MTDLSGRAAIIVDKIPKGPHPADQPITQPTSFELIIILAAAKQIALTNPRSLLQQLSDEFGIQKLPRVRKSKMDKIPRTCWRGRTGL